MHEQAKLQPRSNHIDWKEQPGSLRPVQEQSAVIQPSHAPAEDKDQDRQASEREHLQVGSEEAASNPTPVRSGAVLRRRSILQADRRGTVQLHAREPEPIAVQGSLGQGMEQELHSQVPPREVCHGEQSSEGVRIFNVQEAQELQQDA